MRLSSFLLPLAILLSISSVSAQNLITGTWSNPSTTRDVSTYCCIPTSIQISCPGSTCSATYTFPDAINSKCWNLFLSSTPKLDLYKSNSGVYTEDYTSEITFFGKMTFNFQASNTTGKPRLNINSASSAPSDQCDFTMYDRSAPPTNGSIGGLVIFIIIFFVIVVIGGAKKYQSKQANVIIAQNMAQQPHAVIHVNQPTYAAPNQFPNTQVQFGGNAQVNMNFNGGQRF